MKTFLTCTGAVWATWAALYLTPAPKPPQTAWYDTLIVYEIATVFLVAAFVMLISRRTWTIRAIGLFYALLAVGVLFSNAVLIRTLGYHVVMTPKSRIGGFFVMVRTVPNIDPGVQEAISDLGRAMLFIGGPLLMVGLVMYLIGRFRHVDPALGEWHRGMAERRSGIDRRQGESA